MNLLRQIFIVSALNFKSLQVALLEVHGDRGRPGRDRSACCFP